MQGLNVIKHVHRSVIDNKYAPVISRFDRSLWNNQEISLTIHRSYSNHYGKLLQFFPSKIVTNINNSLLKCAYLQQDIRSDATSSVQIGDESDYKLIVNYSKFKSIYKFQKSKYADKSIEKTGSAFLTNSEDSALKNSCRSLSNRDYYYATIFGCNDDLSNHRKADELNCWKDYNLANTNFDEPLDNLWRRKYINAVLNKIWAIDGLNVYLKRTEKNIVLQLRHAGDHNGRQPILLQLSGKEVNIPFNKEILNCCDISGTVVNDMENFDNRDSNKITVTSMSKSLESSDKHSPIGTQSLIKPFFADNSVMESDFETIPKSTVKLKENLLTDDVDKHYNNRFSAMNSLSLDTDITIPLNVPSTELNINSYATNVKDSNANKIRGCNEIKCFEDNHTNIENKMLSNNKNTEHWEYEKTEPSYFEKSKFKPATVNEVNLLSNVPQSTLNKIIRKDNSISSEPLNISKLSDKNETLVESVDIPESDRINEISGNAINNSVYVLNINKSGAIRTENDNRVSNSTTNIALNKSINLCNQSPTIKNWNDLEIQDKNNGLYLTKKRTSYIQCKKVIEEVVGLVNKIHHGCTEEECEDLKSRIEAMRRSIQSSISNNGTNSESESKANVTESPRKRSRYVQSHETNQLDEYSEVGFQRCNNIKMGTVETFVKRRRFFDASKDFSSIQNSKYKHAEGTYSSNRLRNSKIVPHSVRASMDSKTRTPNLSASKVNSQSVNQHDHKPTSLQCNLGQTIIQDFKPKKALPIHPQAYLLSTTSHIKSSQHRNTQMNYSSNASSEDNIQMATLSPSPSSVATKLQIKPPTKIKTEIKKTYLQDNKKHFTNKTNETSKNDKDSAVISPPPLVTLCKITNFFENKLNIKEIKEKIVDVFSNHRKLIAQRDKVRLQKLQNKLNTSLVRTHEKKEPIFIYPKNNMSVPKVPAHMKSKLKEQIDNIRSLVGNNTETITENDYILKPRKPIKFKPYRKANRSILKKLEENRMKCKEKDCKRQKFNSPSYADVLKNTYYN